LLPMIDIHTIGAGGGSIAYVDQGGAFRVGPRSAGAVPGPAAYGRGGTQPTVTDANVVLGRLDKNDFLGGSMALDEAAAHLAIAELADSLGMNKLEAAEGVLTVINNNMANAIGSRTVQKGIDPRDFTLVAFGGAGPLHGVEVATMLGIPEVIVPPYPGITSAMGLLTTDLKYDTIRTQFQVSGHVDLDRLNSDLAAMERQLTGQFMADHLEHASISFARVGDLRYVGQGYELKIPFAAGTLDQAQLDDIWSRFHDAHKGEYGHYFADSPIEIVNIRVTASGTMPKINKLTAPEGATLAKARVKTGPCVFRIEDELRSFETAFYRRHLLPIGESFGGPAIVLQKDSTTVIPPGWSALNDAVGNLILKLGRAP
jgi:N-methylhydantoinase A